MDLIANLLDLDSSETPHWLKSIPGSPSRKVSCGYAKTSISIWACATALFSLLELQSPFFLTVPLRDVNGAAYTFSEAFSFFHTAW